MDLRCCAVSDLPDKSRYDAGLLSFVLHFPDRVLLLGASSPCARRSTRAILSRPPGRVLVAELQDADDDLFGRRERARKRPRALLLDEARVALRAEAAQPLVAGLPGDAVLPAERGVFAPGAQAFSMNCSFWLMTRCSFQGTATVEQSNLSAMS